MATIKQKIQSLLTASNLKTGQSDTDLTTAVQRLIAGYGGGGSAYQSGDFTPASTGTSYTISVPGTVSNVIVWMDDPDLTIGSRFWFGCLKTPKHKWCIYSNASGSGYQGMQTDSADSQFGVSIANGSITISGNATYCNIVPKKYNWVAW